MRPHSQSKCTAAKATALQVTQPYSMATMLSDLTATAQQLPLCASVGLVLAILGPPSTHGRHHDAVHVEPGLTQRRCVGLAQTALQHVEEGLTHHLQKSKTRAKTCREKHIFFTAHSLVKLLFESCTMRYWSYCK